MERLEADTGAFAALPYAFSRRRLQALREYEAISMLVEKTLLDPMYGLGVAVFAAPVPAEGGSDSFDLEVPIFKFAESLRGDPIAEENKSAADKGQMTLRRSESLLACLANYLLRQHSIAVGIRRSLGLVVKSWSLGVSHPHRVYSIEAPDRFRKIFAPSSRNTPYYQFLIPLVIDKRMVAVVGFDSTNRSDKVLLHVEQTLTMLRKMVRNLYYTYHTALPFQREIVVDGDHDTYSTLVTRRYYDEVVKDETLKMWARPARQCLVVYFDGNGVKKVNDELNHKEGDGVIGRYAGAICKAVESVLTDRLAHNGFVVRWGGDEFIVVMALKQTLPATMAGILTQRVRDALTRSVRKKYRLKDLHLLGLSAGWSVWKGTNFEENAENAEKAMYLCKRVLKVLRDESHLPKDKPVVGMLGYSQMIPLKEMLLGRVAVMEPALPDPKMPIKSSALARGPAPIPSSGGVDLVR